MSFSTRVKDELSLHMSKARHCQIAELAAILADGARISLSEWQIDVLSDHKALVLKTELLLSELFHMRPMVCRRIWLPVSRECFLCRIGCCKGPAAGVRT